MPTESNPIANATVHQRNVILRLHGRSHVGSTFIQILERYAGRLQADGGKLILSGVSQNVWDQLARNEAVVFKPQTGSLSS